MKHRIASLFLTLVLCMGLAAPVWAASTVTVKVDLEVDYSAAYEALEELREQGVVIRNAEASFSRTRLDDMFLFTELELTVQQESITYLLTCQGTWRNGKVEWMQIYVPSVGYDGPAWLPQLSEALATYDPG